MNRHTLILIFCFFAFVSAKAQQDTIAITYSKHFIVGEKDMTYKELPDFLESNRAAHQHIIKAKKNKNAATFFGVTGGLLMAFPIGQAIAGKPANWELLGLGFGFSVISLPLSHAHNKHLRAAIDTYNNAVKSKTAASINLELNPNGLGLALRF